MICLNCNTDLAACSCPDLEQRLNQIKKSKFLHIGSDYEARIRENIKQRKEQKEIKE